MNARIGQYMNPLNKRKDYPLVDDKINTAELAVKYNVPMPENYLLFQSYGDTKHLSKKLQSYNSFVIKPARGAMGNGIVVIDRTEGESFVKTNGKELSSEDIRYHILQIIGGLYSLSGRPDRAILQYKIDLHGNYENFSYQGIPDIRVIVYHGYPIMAMSRLTTTQSDGRANLHQGAVGAGLNMLTGQATGGCLKDKFITLHPDTQARLTDLKVPFWEEILFYASKCYDMTNMGYLGVDFVIDKKFGPMILEMNARPGLSIQVANNRGLKEVLQKFSAYTHLNLNAEERVCFAQDLLKEY